MNHSPTIPAIVESIAALSEEERSQLFAQLYKRHLITPIWDETLRDKTSDAKNEGEKEILDIANDPLVGLFSDDPHLATESEDILTREITPRSGWTWKEELQ